MSARISIRFAGRLLGLAIVTGCTGGPAVPHHVTSQHAASRVTVAAPRPVTRADVSRCPKTAAGHYPHEAMPTGAGDLRFPTTPIMAVMVPRDFAPGTFAFGNGRLWTVLAISGVLVASGDMIRPNGSIWWKFPWWRMVAGHLAITGRRLDAPAPPLESRVPIGYGDIGFQASGVIFAAEGCWQVTAKIAHTSLTFVTFVITQAHSAVIFSNR